MRLGILDSGHSFGTKALFALIRTVSRQPVLDVIKLVKYHPDFYGEPIPRLYAVGDLGSRLEQVAAFACFFRECRK